MRLRLFLWTGGLVFSFHSVCQGPPSTATLLHGLLLPTVPAVFNGRPLDEDDLKQYPYVAMMKIGKDGICTMIVVGSCGLPDLHCIDNDFEKSVYFGIKPDTTTSGYKITEKPILLGDKSRKKMDLAVVKIDGLPRQHTASTLNDILPTADEIKKLKNDTSCNIVGYGASESREHDDGHFEEVGWGRIRIGDVKYKGRCSLNGDNTNSNYLKVSRDPSIGGSGDSGGPLVCFGKVFGLYSEAIGIIPGSSEKTHDKLQKKYAKRPESWTTEASYSSLVDNREEIEKAMKTLKCF